MSSGNIRNSVWNIIDVLLYPALYLFFTPFFIHHLGQELYGLWILVNTLIVFMQVFNFGLGISTLRNVSKCIATGDTKGIARLINSNLALVLLLSAACLLLGTVIALLIRYQSLFHVSVSNRPLAALSVFLAVFIVTAKFIEQIFTNTLIAFERIAVVARYNTISRLANLFVAMALIYKGQSISLVLTCTILISYTSLGLLLVFIRKTLGEFRLRPRWNPLLVKAELRFSTWIWIQSVLVILAFQCDKFLVAYWIGVAGFSFYSIASTMFNHLHMALTAIAPWAMPQLAKRFTAGKDIIRYFLSVRSLVLGLSYLALLSFHLLYLPVFTLWLGPALLSSLSGYLQLFLVFELFFVFTITPYFLLNAMHQERLQTLNTLIYTLLSIAGMLAGYLLTAAVTGLIKGLLCGMVMAVIIQQLLLNNRILKLSAFHESIGLLSPMLLLSVYVYPGTLPVSVRFIALAASICCFGYYYLYRYRVHWAELRAAQDHLLTD